MSAQEVISRTLQARRIDRSESDQYRFDKIVVSFLFQVNFIFTSYIISIIGMIKQLI